MYVRMYTYCVDYDNGLRVCKALVRETIPVEYNELTL